jgi:ureidoacrylate peracid hydrolase
MTATALVLIEYQNDFTSAGGVLHEAVKPVMQSTGMLGHTVATVKRARELGVILKGVVDGKAFRKGTWGAEIVDMLAPEEQDIVIEGKRGLDAFASTNLDFILRARGIERLALAGFLTNCCVESTMRTGYEKGYDVVTLTDCTATVGEDEQRFSVEKNFPMFSRPMTHDAFLAELEGRPAEAA